MIIIIPCKIAIILLVALWPSWLCSGNKLTTRSTGRGTFGLATRGGRAYHLPRVVVPRLALNSRTPSRLSLRGGGGEEEKEESDAVDDDDDDNNDNDGDSSSTAESETTSQSPLIEQENDDNSDRDNHRDDHDKNNNNDDDDRDRDEERYSRQVYALGARAHGLIRTSTVYLDGPSESGLLYECAKNLALSGVRELVLVVDDDNDDDDDDKEDKTEAHAELAAYHDPDFDDLGRAYERAARAELRERRAAEATTTTMTKPADEILVEFLRRLNPSVRVSRAPRSSLRNSPMAQSGDGEEDGSGDNNNNNGVLLCMDRPYPTQRELNEWSRRQKMAFVSVETAGVYGRVFCDFGSEFTVHDADGETPVETPLDRIEAVGDRGDRGGDEQQQQQLMLVHCVEGERHDVSKGDVIEFQFRNGKPSPDRCVVLDVQTPFRFAVARVLEEIGGDGKERQTTTTETAVDGNEFVSEINERAASFRRIKIPRRLSFESIEDALQSARTDASLFTACDLDKSFDEIRRASCLSFFQALPVFITRENRFPTVRDADEFSQLARESWSSDNGGGGDEDPTAGQEGKRHLLSFLRTCRAKFAPLQAFFGAIGAQEALKAASGLYYPVKQFLLYDCDEVLEGRNSGKGGDSDASSSPSAAQGEVESSTCPSSSSPAPCQGLREIVGPSVAEELRQRRIFLVGAGAIGCEILKNLAAMGVGTEKKGGRENEDGGGGRSNGNSNGKGKIVLTDMDTIEKSNLSRQLLFRDSDIGAFKSAAARNAILRFDPSLNVEAHSSKVGETVAGTPFDDEFWSREVDIVLNALDNVEARLYMDGQCVAHRRALVDAGTMGSKGNVQVVVPHKSESYASSVDPPEPSIPVCTLKNFPYAISHTIQWGRDLFDGLFRRRPVQANDFVEERLARGALRSSGALEDVVSGLIRNVGEEMAVQTAEELGEDVSDLLVAAEAGQEGAVSVDRIRTRALAWAARLARKLFREAALELLSEHPADSLDEDGEPFWSGTRRPPKALSFSSGSSSSLDDKEQDKIDENLINFVQAAARLRAETFLSANTGIGEGDDGDPLFAAEEARDILEQEFGRAAAGETGEGEHPSDNPSRVRAHLKRIITAVPDKNDGSTGRRRRRLHVAEFEKDDESNGHIAFVTTSSNLRAMCYGIPPADAMETRRVAGNIVPAMITTTALVSALSCVELVKLVRGAPLRSHRNAFVNLALPFFAFTAPLPAETIPGLRGREYTLWDRLFVQEGKQEAAAGGLSVQSLLGRIKLACDDEPEKVGISSVSFGPYMLYADFLHEDDEEVLGAPLWDLMRDAISSSEDFDAHYSRDEAGRDDEGDIDVHYTDAHSYVDVRVVVEDLETGEEVELPPVRVQKYKSE